MFKDKTVLITGGTETFQKQEWQDHASFAESTILGIGPWRYFDNGGIKMDDSARLNKVFRLVFEDQSLQVTPEMTANDIEGWDSMAQIKLIVSIEREFAIEFSQREALSFKNIEDMFQCIQKKLSSTINN